MDAFVHFVKCFPREREHFEGSIFSAQLDQFRLAAPPSPNLGYPLGYSRDDSSYVKRKVYCSQSELHAILRVGLRSMPFHLPGLCDSFGVTAYVVY